MLKTVITTRKSTSNMFSSRRVGERVLGWNTQVKDSDINCGDMTKVKLHKNSRLDRLREAREHWSGEAVSEVAELLEHSRDRPSMNVQARGKRWNRDARSWVGWSCARKVEC